MKRQNRTQKLEHPKSDELREAVRGLLTVKFVIFAARPENDDRSPEELFEISGAEWRKILEGAPLVEGPMVGESLLPHQWWGSVLKTGVSVVARRGVFHTEYYVPGEADAIRRSTKISLDGINPPQNVRDNPLWWWESSRRLEILQCLENAILERFSEHAEFIIHCQAQKAALAAWPYLEKCLLDISDLKGDTLRGFDDCVRIFADYGINLPMTETFASYSKGDPKTYLELRKNPAIVPNGTPRMDTKRSG